MNSDNKPASRVPLVSVVMPVYNAMPYLEMSIKSIFAQSIQDWELILVDDCSTDGSWEFLRTLVDPRLRLFRNDHNRGHSYSKNRCVQEASGRYIASMDADDISLPNRIARQVEILESHSGIDVVGCGIIKVDSVMRPIRVSKMPALHEQILNVVPFDIRFLFGPNFQLVDGTSVARREWFRKWKYDVRVKYSEDFDLFLRASATSRYANVSDPLYVYVRSGATASVSAQMSAIACKTKSLALYGLRKGMRVRTALSLFSLGLRPLFILATELHHRLIIERSEERLASILDGRYLEIMDSIAQVSLPRKRCEAKD